MFLYAKTLVMIEILLLAGMLLYRLALSRRNAAIVSPRVVGLAMLTPAVGLFCGNAFIFYAYLACAVAFNSRRRTELACGYVMMLPLMPALSLETGVGGVYVAPFSTVLAMNLGALVGFAVSSGRKRSFAGGYDWALAGLILIFLYIYSREASVTAVLRGILLYSISYAGPFLLISRAMTKREDVERLLLHLVLGGVLAAVAAMFQAYRHWLIYQTFYNALHIEVPLQSWTLAMRAGLMRTGGSMLDYSAAGVFFAVLVSVMPILWRRFKPGFNWLVMLVLVGGLISAQSRGGWVAAIVGLSFVLVYLRRYGLAALIGGSAASAQAFVYFFVRSGKLASIAGATEEAGGTLDYRTRLLSRGLEQVIAHPVFGQTQQQLVANLADMVQGQKIVDFVNAHLFIAMVAGLPLFAIWLLVWSAPIVQSWRLRTLRLADADLAGVPAALIVPSMVAILATSSIDRNLVWPTIGLALAAPCFALARGDREKLPERPAARAARGLLRPAGPKRPATTR